MAPKTYKKPDALQAPIEPKEGENLPASLEEVFQQEIALLIQKAGTIELKPKQKEILYAPVKESDVEIRSDGLIYLPWMEYVTRLKNAFDMRWAVIPKGMPTRGPGDRSIIWGFYLVIEGKLAGFAIGEQEYFPNNPVMNWSDACEGAKSNALMRLCKGIGIGLELWQPKFINTWKSKNVEAYYNEKGKKCWRKKGAGPADEKKQKVNVKKSGGKPALQPKVQPGTDDGAPSPETSTNAPGLAVPGRAEVPETTEAPQPAQVVEVEPAQEMTPEAYAQYKEAKIVGIKKALETKAIDAKRFKLWLAEYFGPLKSRIFVGRNQFGHLSFHFAKDNELELMHKHLSWIVSEYIDYDQLNPDWADKFEVPEQGEEPPF